MSRPPHHPDCALSKDIAKTRDENLDGYRAPLCTCRQLRKSRSRIKQRYARSGRSVLSEGSVSIGDGNYWRPPLHTKGY